MPACRNRQDVLAAGNNLRVNWDNPLTQGLSCYMVPDIVSGRARDIAQNKQSDTLGLHRTDSGILLPSYSDASVANAGYNVAAPMTAVTYMRILDASSYVGAGIINYVSESSNSGFIIQQRVNEGVTFSTFANTPANVYRLLAPSITSNQVGAWHLAGSFDGTTKKFYVNGRLDISASGTMLSPPSSTPALADGKTGKGYFGYFGFWRRVLSAEEIRQLYDPATQYKILWRPSPKTYFYAPVPTTPPPPTILVKQPKLVNPFHEGITSPLTTGIGRASEDSLRQGLVGAWCPSLTVTKSQLLPDLSGYGNHGTLTNMDPPNDWVTSGGKMALDFDGANDQVLITDSTILNPTAQITVALWYNARALPGTPAYTTCWLSKATGVDSQPYPAWDIRGSGATTIEAAMAIGALSRQVSLGTINTNEWTFISFTYNGSAFVGYRNGLQVASNAQTGAIGTTTNPISMGNNFGFSPRYFNGRLDDIRIYNRALTPSEIQLLYSGGRGFGLRAKKTKVFSVAAPVPPTTIIVKQPKLINPLYESVTSQPWTSTGRSSEDNLRQGLVGAWSPAATGPTGYTLYDLSGNNNHGTLTNMDPATDWVGANVKGRSVGALDFDGVNDYIDTNSNLGLAGSQFVTFSAWLLRPEQNTQQVFGFGDTVNKRADVLWFTDNKIYVQFETGSNQSYPSSAALTLAGIHHVAVRFDGTLSGLNRVKLFVNGLSQSLSAGNANPGTTIDANPGTFKLMREGTRYGKGYIIESLAHNRAMSDAEIFQLYQLGPGWLARPKQRASVLTVAPSVTPINVYTLPASTGSFTLTGNATGLTRQLKMPAAVGQFSLTGNAANLVRGLKLSAAVQSFTLTGNAAGLLKGYKLSCSSGNFSLTGQDAVLKADRKVSCSAGSFSLTGNAISLLWNHKLTAALGQFTFTGNDAGLTRQFTLGASTGSFSLTGIASTFRLTHVLAPSTAVFTLTGLDTGLAFNRVLSVTRGIYTLTGLDVVLRKRSPLIIPAHQFVGGNFSYVLKSAKGTSYVVKKQVGESYIG